MSNFSLKKGIWANNVVEIHVCTVAAIELVYSMGSKGVVQLMYYRRIRYIYSTTINIKNNSHICAQNTLFPSPKTWNLNTRIQYKTFCNHCVI